MDKSDLLEFRLEERAGFRLAHTGKHLRVDPEYSHVTRVIDSWEIIVVDKGTLYMREGNRRYELKPGSMLLLEPGREHGGYRVHDADFYWLHFFSGPFRRRKFTFLQVLKENRGTSRAEGVCVPKFYTFSRPGALYTVLNEYLECAGNTPVYKQERMLNRFRDILFRVTDLVLEQEEDTAPVRDAQVHHVWRIMQYLRQHYRRNVNIKQVAAWAGLNRDYANRIFKAANGCSIQEYLIRVRLEEARGLFENEALTIAQVAEQVGYDDPYYFSRLFKKKMRMSPKKYRETIYKVRN